jgi:hypothetical protein
VDTVVVAAVDVDRLVNDDVVEDAPDTVVVQIRSISTNCVIRRF